MEDYLKKVQHALGSIDLKQVAKAVKLLKNRKVFIVGNGGSAATSSHFACDLQKAACKTAISLTDNMSLITAWANDCSYDFVFSQQMLMLANPGDVLVLISASGNSKNIIECAKRAKDIGLKTIGLSGFGGGKLSKLVDVSIVVDSSEYGPVEDAHSFLCHMFTEELK